MTREQLYQRAYSRRKRAVTNGAKAAMGCRRCHTHDERVLEFHHRDPDNKVSRVSASMSRQDKLAEMARCDVLCANCHLIEQHEMKEQTYA